MSTANKPLLSLLGLIAVATMVAAGALVHHELAPRTDDRFGGTGSLVAVTVLGGQVYYGTLLEARPDSIKLENVYYVQQFTEPNTNQPGNRLVNRAKTDWHGPTWMVLPMDRILGTESVGAESRLAQLIAEERKLPAPVKP